MYIYGSIPLNCSIVIPYTLLSDTVTHPTIIHISVKQQATATFIYHYIGIYVPATNVPLKYIIYGMCLNYSTYINKKSMPIHMPCTNLLPSPMWPEMLYTEDNELVDDNVG